MNLFELLLSTFFGFMLAILTKKEIGRIRKFIISMVNHPFYKKSFLGLLVTLIITASFYGMLVFTILLDKGYSIPTAAIFPLLFIASTVNIFHKGILLFETPNAITKSKKKSKKKK